MFIGGPCYDPENQIVCRFNKTTEISGVYVSPELAYCITPPLYFAGRIQVELSMDAGETFNFTGTFRSSELKCLLIYIWKYLLICIQTESQSNIARCRQCFVSKHTKV